MWNNRISSLALTAILVLNTIFIITTSAAGGSNGTILYVGGNGPGNYTLIQSAINAASNDDTLFVYKGIYHENVVINKSIYLIGENKSITIIDGNKSANAVTLLADGIRLSGFTITTNMNDSNALSSSSFSSNNSILGNAKTYNNYSGIYIYKSSSNTIIDTIVTGNIHYGIKLDYSNNTAIIDTIVTGNTHYGIKLDSSSSNNTIMGNTITYNNWYGIYLESFSNIISGNTITNNDDGVYLRSFSNIIEGNNITNNGNGIYLYTGVSPAYSRDIIKGNIIKGNTITNNNNGVYLYFDAFCPSCKDSIITANILTGNIITYNTYGIDLFSSPTTTIAGNIITYNTYGIDLSYSSNNSTIMGNIISHNVNGIDFYHSGSNIIYHNNFINNSMQVNASSEVTNTWDNGYPSGGNYWDTYIGVDADEDHIGDTPYFIPGDDNLDRYPLMMPYKIRFNHPPTCVLLASITNETVPLTVTFTMTTSDLDGTITTWALDIDNDGMSDYSDFGAPPPVQQHTYNNTGTYIANLMVTDNQSSTASDSTIIMVSPVPLQNKEPIAQYTCSLQNPTTQDIIQFTDMSTDIDGYIINWTWNFGDGNHSYLQYPTHQYTTGGKYYVTLQVKDNDGKVNITSHELIVIYHEYDHYMITVDIQPANGGTVTLNPLDGVYNEGTLVTAIAVANIGYEFSYWSINSNDSIQNSSVQIIMDSNKTLTAHFEAHNIFPIANFQYTINELKVIFMDNSTETDGYITHWYWDFGDNNSSILINPLHTYKEGGSYTVTLAITDDKGDTDTYSKIITVQLEKDEDKGTPGFEIALLIIVLLIFVIILQKKR